MPLRVIGGEAKGHPLRSLRGLALRPTQARVRAALFSILGEVVVRGPFLDLYAGTGAVGIEALSRGAPWADFVEQYRPAARVLMHNLAATGLGERARVVVAPVGVFLARPADRRYAVVFADPPYGTGRTEEVLRALAGWSGISAETLVVVQHRKGEQVSVGGWRRLRSETYGETCLSFFKLEGGAQ
ncbi:MAG: 16S rRNA (guanine(966)-N(2))-methyltransferase RsmD [Firmicutes bacterium]|nr:16S rRNA (guanine(966)-N(2))-methyltransferase RsmD [Bacillota bacterium]